MEGRAGRGGSAKRLNLDRIVSGNQYESTINYIYKFNSTQYLTTQYAKNQLIVIVSINSR